MIHVLATVTLAPGTRAQFLEVFNGNVPAVHAEDGCIEYGAAVDAPTDMAVQSPIRPDAVVVVEKWRDVVAKAGIRPWCKGRPDATRKRLLGHCGSPLRRQGLDGSCPA